MRQHVHHEAAGDDASAAAPGATSSSAAPARARAIHGRRAARVGAPRAPARGRSGAGAGGARTIEPRAARAARCGSCDHRAGARSGGVRRRRRGVAAGAVAPTSTPREPPARGTAVGRVAPATLVRDSSSRSARSVSPIASLARSHGARRRARSTARAASALALVVGDAERRQVARARARARPSSPAAARSAGTASPRRPRPGASPPASTSLMAHGSRTYDQVSVSAVAALVEEGAQLDGSLAFGRTWKRQPPAAGDRVLHARAGRASSAGVVAAATVTTPRSDRVGGQRRRAPCRRSRRRSGSRPRSVPRSRRVATTRPAGGRVGSSPYQVHACRRSSIGSPGFGLLVRHPVRDDVVVGVVLVGISTSSTRPVAPVALRHDPGARPQLGARLEVLVVVEVAVALDQPEARRARHAEAR